MRRTLLLAAGGLVYAHAGYALLVAALHRAKGSPPPYRAPAPGARRPSASLVVAAHDEASVIAAKVANAKALAPPPLEVIVACDGCADDTVARAREAGADLVLDLPRGGKVRAQDAAVARARGDVVAFSDANALWERGALGALLGPFAADAKVGFACGRVAFTNAAGTNQEGVYWRLEMWLRSKESALASVTAGNGAIYAVRRRAYFHADPVMGHDLSFPHELVRRGWRCVDVPPARATEKMVPSVEGEAARKRRMMTHGWPIVLRGGLLDPRGRPPLYNLMVLSHRGARYATPFLHVALLLASLRRGRLERVALLAQLALLGAAAAGGRDGASRPELLARWYVATTAAIGLGLVDVLRHGTQAGWDAPEGTR